MRSLMSIPGWVPFFMVLSVEVGTQTADSVAEFPATLGRHRFRFRGPMSIVHTGKVPRWSSLAVSSGDAASEEFNGSGDRRSPAFGPTGRVSTGYRSEPSEASVVVSAGAGHALRSAPVRGLQCFSVTRHPYLRAMYASVTSVTLVGVEPQPVDVEVHVGGHKSALVIVGLPDTAVREARDRVRAALRSSGYVLPSQTHTVNLAPADLPKAGSAYDLPIALACLAGNPSDRAAPSFRRHPRRTGPRRRRPVCSWRACCRPARQGSRCPLRDGR